MGNVLMHPYKSGPIEPVLLPGEIAGIWIDRWIFVKLDFFEPLVKSEQLMHDFGALAAGASSGTISLTELDVHQYNFAQYRFQVCDDITAELHQGSASARFGNMNRVTRITGYNQIADPCGHMTEFFVYEQNHAHMLVTNETDYALTQSRVVFWGYKYNCSLMPNYSEKSPPPAYTRIPATAFIRGGR